jgi:hypothetical protein
MLSDIAAISADVTKRDGLVPGIVCEIGRSDRKWRAARDPKDLDAT